MKNKKRQRVLALLLCMLLAFSLTACSKKKEESTTNPDNSSLEDHPFWVSNEKETLRVWTQWANSYLESPDEIPAMAKMEEMTNVDIVWNTVSNQEYSEKYGLMIASGDLPDIIFDFATSYPGGWDKGISDGILIDVKDLVEQYMPNYKAFRESDPNLIRDTMTDSGKLPAVYMFRSDDFTPEEEPAWCGLLVRKDWLDDLNMELPVTMDDWETMLTAFKNEKGADAPLIIGPTANTLGSSFVSAFGILQNYCLKDGKVVYGPAEPEYKDFLETMHRWYENGLIDPNFISSQNWMIADTSYIATGRSGACFSSWNHAAGNLYTMGYTDDANINWVGVKAPVLNVGEVAQARCRSGIANVAANITTSCKKTDIAAKWLDFQYTREGILLNNYGIEGEDYTIDENDNIALTDKIANNPDYSASDAMGMNTRGDGAGLVSWRRFDLTADPNALAAKEVWQSDGIDLCLPTAMALTEEEGTDFNFRNTSINTQRDEMTVKFIMGEESLDNFDAYVESLYSMGLETCIEYQQTAYDRYLNRK